MICMPFQVRESAQGSQNVSCVLLLLGLGNDADRRLMETMNATGRGSSHFSKSVCAQQELGMESMHRTSAGACIL